MDLISIVSAAKLLKKQLSHRIFIVPIYLRSHDLSRRYLKLKISNNLGHKTTINGISLYEINGEQVVTTKRKGPKEPFEIGNKDFKNQIIFFRGKLRDEKNKVKIGVAVEDFRKRDRVIKELSVELEREKLSEVI